MDQEWSLLNNREETQPLLYRLCQLCARGDIGEETHYILKCPYFDNERRVYIKPYYMRGESNLKISKLFNITDQEVLKKLSRFIQCILTKFAN